jgi:BlaI family penicillinase repressor
MARQKKEKYDRLADAELDIMNLLWSRGEALKASEIVKELSGKREWKPQTAHVLLHRLADREFIFIDKSQYSHKFGAAISEKDYLLLESNTLRRRIGGNFKSLVASLIEAENVTDEDITELENLLASKRAQLAKKDM